MCGRRCLLLLLALWAILLGVLLPPCSGGFPKSRVPTCTSVTCEDAAPGRPRITAGCDQPSMRWEREQRMEEGCMREERIKAGNPDFCTVRSLLQGIKDHMGCGGMLDAFCRINLQPCRQGPLSEASDGKELMDGHIRHLVHPKGVRSAAGHRANGWRKSRRPRPRLSHKGPMPF